MYHDNAIIIFLINGNKWNSEETSPAWGLWCVHNNELLMRSLFGIWIKKWPRYNKFPLTMLCPDKDNIHIDSYSEETPLNTCYPI